MSKKLKWGNQIIITEVGNRTFKFHSKLEHRWAQYLEFLKRFGHVQYWNYEETKFVFEGETHSPYDYTPDFIVHTSKGETEYHECKGCLRGRDVSRYIKLKKFYPKTVLHLVLDRPDIRAKKRLTRCLKYGYVNRVIYARDIEAGFIFHSEVCLWKDIFNQAGIL